MLSNCVAPKDLDKQLFVLKNCKKNFDCLVHEMCNRTQFEPNYLRDIT